MLKNMFFKFMFVMFSIYLIGCDDRVAGASSETCNRTIYEIYYSKEVQYASSQDNHIVGYEMWSDMMYVYGGDAYALHPLKHGHRQRYEIDFGGSGHIKTYRF